MRSQMWDLRQNPTPYTLQNSAFKVFTILRAGCHHDATCVLCHTVSQPGAVLLCLTHYKVKVGVHKFLTPLFKL